MRDVGKDVTTDISVSLLHCGAGLTSWLDNSGLAVHVVNHSSVGAVLKVNGSGSLIVATNHLTTILQF